VVKAIRALGPCRHHRVAYADYRGEEVAPVSEDHGLGNIGAELQLVLDELRAEPVAPRCRRDVLEAVDHHEVALRVEIPGIARVQPPVAPLARRVARAEIAREDGGVAGDDLSQPIGVRPVDPHLDLGVERDADAVEIHLPLAVQRVGAEQFRLPVELAQRHAEGEEEAERIRPERRTSRGDRGDPREAQAVAQRAKQERIGRARRARQAASAAGRRISACRADRRSRSSAGEVRARRSRAACPPAPRPQPAPQRRPNARADRRPRRRAHRGRCRVKSPRAHALRSLPSPSRAGCRRSARPSRRARHRGREGRARSPACGHGTRPR